MPWLTPEEALVKQAVAGYYEALHECGASEAALALGCTCPVLDNHHGHGARMPLADWAAFLGL